MDSSVLKRMARAFPVLRLLALVTLMSTRILNSVSRMLRRASITSRLTMIATSHRQLMLLADRHRVVE